MFIKCIANQADKLNIGESLRLCINEFFNFENNVLPLKVGKEYAVYGICFKDLYAWFLIYDEDEAPYPVFYPSVFFEIVDSALSRTWRFQLKPTSDGTRPDINDAIICCSSWNSSSSFYEKLVDGDKDAVEKFGEYKKILDKEIAQGRGKPEPEQD